jgi:beta-glucuronidase
MNQDCIDLDRPSLQTQISSKIQGAAMKFLSPRPSARSACRTYFFALAVALLVVPSLWAAPIVLTGADRRPATSLNGDWASIVDPYFSGLFSFHHQEKADGWFFNQKAKSGDPFPTEYDFSRALTLKVPADWNTQRESLYYYEGPVWYERDFAYQLKERTRVLLHVGAAN